MNAVTEINSTPQNPIEMAGLIGALSANVANLTKAIEHQGEMFMKFDERLRAVENTVEKLQANQRPKTPWWTVVGGIASATVVVAFVIALIVYFANNGPL